MIQLTVCILLVLLSQMLFTFVILTEIKKENQLQELRYIYTRKEIEDNTTDLLNMIHDILLILEKEGGE